MYRSIFLPIMYIGVKINRGIYRLLRQIFLLLFGNSHFMHRDLLLWVYIWELFHRNSLLQACNISILQENSFMQDAAMNFFQEIGIFRLQRRIYSIKSLFASLIPWIFPCKFCFTWLRQRIFSMKSLAEKKNSIENICIRTCKYLKKFQLHLFVGTTLFFI